MSIKLCEEFPDVTTLNLGGGYKARPTPGRVRMQGLSVGEEGLLVVPGCRQWCRMARVGRLWSVAVPASLWSAHVCPSSLRHSQAMSTCVFSEAPATDCLHEV